MFVVVYAFTSKPGRDEAFRTGWADLTRCIYQERGSLGSRLHRTGEHSYIAYAQWPARAVFEASRAMGEGSTEMMNAKTAMREAMASIEIVYEMDVLTDMLESGAHA